MFKYIFFLFIAIIGAGSSDCSSENYYWVGGNGSWSEINHWATTSGGNVFHSAVPGFDDNVFFDVNSFTSAGQLVDLNVDFAFCANMNWSGALDNSGFDGSGTLNIFGSFILKSNLVWNYRGEINFYGEEKNFQFNAENNILQNNINFVGTKADWTIYNDINAKSISFIGDYSKYVFLANMHVADDILIENNNGIVQVNQNVTIGKSCISSANNVNISLNANTTLGLDFIFAGDLSVCSLGGDFTVGRNLRFLSGTMLTNQNYFSCLNFYSYGAGNRVFNFEKSIVTIGGSFLVSGENYLSNADSSKIIFTGTASVMDGGFDLQYYDIEYIATNGLAEFKNNTCSFNKVVFNLPVYLTGSNNTINHADCRKNAEFFDTTYYKKLILSKGCTYVFHENSVQNVSDSIESKGDCTHPVLLKCKEESKQATIKCLTGNAAFEYNLLKGIHAEGSVAFIANNSFDLGYNSGWTINELVGTNLYWVGGSGVWDDVMHWSYSSGGPGGACVPFPTDNVIFNQNSFSAINQYVAIQSENVFCNDITWENVSFYPEFKSVSNTVNLNVYGSFTLSASMNYAFYGYLKFESGNAGNFITMAGNQLNNSVYFNGLNGEWAFTDKFDLTNINNLYLNNGRLITNDQEVYCAKFISHKNNSPRRLDLGSSEFHVNSEWDLNSDDFQLNAGTSTIFFDSNGGSMKSGSNLSYYNVNFTAVMDNLIEGVNNYFNQIILSGQSGIGLKSSTVNNLIAFKKSSVTGNNNVFNTAEFLSDTEILDNNTFANLTFSKGTVCKIGANKTLTIINNLIANGDCSENIVLQSTGKGQSASIKKELGTLEINYIIMNDINATGGAIFTANNVFDMGNNTGWSLNFLTSRNLYWIGNTGNWSNTAHWSAISGGSGGECVPGPIDNVYIDQNSFSGNGDLIIDVPQIYCYTMDWSNSDDDIIFSQSEQSKLNLYGSLYLNSHVTPTFSGNILFLANNEQHINLLNTQLASDLIFENTSGIWNLSGKLTTTGSIFLNSGVINVYDNPIVCNSFVSKTVSESVLNTTVTDIVVGTLWDTDSNFKLLSTGGTLQFSNTGTFKHQSNFEQKYPNIIFNNSGSVLVNQSGGKAFTCDTVSFSGISTAIFNAINTKIGKLKFNLKSEIRGSAEIDTLICSSQSDIYGAHKFGKACFYGNSTISNSQQFVHAIFYDNAYLKESNTFDTLQFSPNHSYTLGIYKTQKVDKEFYVKGNSCYKIRINSDVPDIISVIEKNGSDVEGYALDLRDVSAMGTARFYASGPSNNTSNNPGWIFKNKPGYIYGFNNDTIIDENTTFTLTTESFNGDRNTRYTWHDGSTSDHFITNTPIRASVIVDYAETGSLTPCRITDYINVFYVDKQNESCVGKSDGSIKILSDPVYNYKFEWSNAVSGSFLNKIGAGNYVVKVTDLQAGTYSTKNIGLLTNDLFTVNGSVTNAFCTGKANGAITLAINGGNPPYLISWDGFPDSSLNTLTNLLPDTSYIVQVSDQNNCPAISKEFSIFPDNIFEADTSEVKHVSCYDTKDGAITVSVSGGAMPYIYQWLHNSQLHVNNADSLQAGVYNIRVTDNNNCSDSVVVEIQQPAKLELEFSNVVSPACNGFSNGVLTLYVIGGILPYSYNNQLFNDNYRYIDNLEANREYIFTIEDKNKCITEKIINLSEPDLLKIDSLDVVNASCYQSTDGEVHIFASGGTGALTYSLNNVDVFNSFYNGLAAGNYWLKITDEHNCILTHDKIIQITEPDKLILDWDVIHPKPNNNGVLQVFPENMQIQIYNSGYIEIPYDTILYYLQASNLSPDMYKIIATDLSGCSDSAFVLLEYSEYNSEVIVPNIFTPDDDGINDFFKIEFTDIKETDVVLYDRWGSVIKKWNSPDDFWDGSRNGHQSDEGVYFYIINALGLDNEKYVLSGAFHLVRH